jgi:glucose-6-phosphate isomerase
MLKISGDALSKIDRNSPEYKELLEAHSRLAKKDASLWGDQAKAEAAIRLNWIDLPHTSRELLPTLDALAAKHRDKSEIILCGMGGSSLGPEVIAATFKKQLFVLDSTDPNYFAYALKKDLSKTLVIVSSKSGSTIETSSQRSIFEQSFIEAKLDPTEHMVFVTDPGSTLDQQARRQGFSVINADPHVGGRFSVLSAFGLVPAALMDIDVSVLLDQAEDTKMEFLSNPELVCDISYLLSYVGSQYISFTDADSHMPGLSDWIEQLIAESTGKNGLGRLPVVVKGSDEVNSSDVFTIAFFGSADLVVEADLASQFIIWEWVTALLGFALKVDPFNQPNVTEAKDATSQLLSQWKVTKPSFVPDHLDGEVEIFGEGVNIKDSLSQLIQLLPSDGYIAVMAYLDRDGDSKISQIQKILSEKTKRPVTFGWGPRFLHSTGQFHKGGQPNGVFLQITGDSSYDIDIPGQGFSLGTLIAAQALGDANALALRKYPLLRLNLKQRQSGIESILGAAQSL